MTAPARAVDVETAHSLIQAQNHVLLDVRTAEEFAQGHAPGAINVPVMLNSAEERVPNPDFVQQARERLPAGVGVCTTCGGGSRGPTAADKLAAAGGVGTVCCMAPGMKGWAASDLPLTEASEGGTRL